MLNPICLCVYRSLVLFFSFFLLIILEKGTICCLDTQLKNSTLMLL